MKTALRWIILFLACTVVCLFAQERRITERFGIGENHYTFTGNLDAWQQVQLQIKLNNLLCDILADEAKGLNPHGKIELAKKLARSLQ